MLKLSSILKTSKIIIGLSLFGLVIHGDLKEQFLRNYVGRNTYKVLSGGGSGSGFVVRYGGNSVVITNAHVCGNQTTVGLEDANHRAVGVAKVIYKDDDLDICAVENIENKFGLVIQNHNSYFGQTLNIVGYPSGRQLTIHSGSYIGTKDIEIIKTEFKVCSGRLIQLSLFEQLMMRTEKNFACIQLYPSMSVAAIAFPGNSGSCVVSNFGTVVGILFAGSDQLTDSFVIPSDRLIKFLDSLWK